MRVPCAPPTMNKVAEDCHGYGYLVGGQGSGFRAQEPTSIDLTFPPHTLGGSPAPPFQKEMVLQLLFYSFITLQRNGNM
jgi:hypothetical protein